MSAPSCPRLAPAVTPVSQRVSLLGESPLWCPTEQALFWVDIAGQSIVRHDADGTEQHWPLAEEPACLAPAADGRLVVGLRSGVGLFDPADGSLRQLAAAPWDVTTTRSNDGRCDPQGRFWVGTVFEPKTADAAGLYCLTADTAAPGGWTLREHLGGNLTANGLAFAADGRRAWWSNTPRHLIQRYAVDPATGTFSSATLFHQFAVREAGTPYGGRPDGACLDTEGAYWVAMYEGGQVLRLGPAGEILLAVHLPVTCPTMVCLGGADLRTLFITTACKGRPPAERAAEPLAGHVLAIALDALGLPASVRGMPADRWAGAI